LLWWTIQDSKQQDSLLGDVIQCYNFPSEQEYQCIAVLADAGGFYPDLPCIRKNKGKNKGKTAQGISTSIMIIIRYNASKQVSKLLKPKSTFAIRMLTAIEA
jgi:hypothetical protein